MTDAKDSEPSGFEVFEGEIEAPFASSDNEILNDLYAVVDAVEQKPVRLTKSGIPPKPLWAAINQRLIWSDPTNKLYDWEEVDQVRFLYLMAMRLDLIRSNEEGWLHSAPGADQFFMAEPIQRAEMILSAYFNIWAWDERCDARNDQGHRYNFGRAFRRDFVHDVVTLRVEAFNRFRLVPQQWVRTAALAKSLSEDCPTLLISEVCELPTLNEEGIDLEKLRFINYWLTLLARFGWADIARAPGDDSSQRLCRLTELGEAVVKELAYEEPVPTSLTIDSELQIQVFKQESTACEQYVACRLSAGLREGSEDLVGVYPLTHDSLSRAAAKGVDLEKTLHWLTQRSSDDVPEALLEIVSMILQNRSKVRILQNVLAVEIFDEEAPVIKDLESAGFDCAGGVAMATGPATPRLFRTLGGEPPDGFDYPPEEPFGRWTRGPEIQLFYEELPLMHRNLLEIVGPEGDPLKLKFTPEKLSLLRENGWDLGALRHALVNLTQRQIPAKVEKQFREILEA